jgi:hypothetical protein
VRAAERTGPRPKNPDYQLSRLSGMVFLALFLIGVAGGAVEYARRSPVIARHVAGSNAITIYVVLAIATAAAVIGIQARRSRWPAQRGRSPWAAPFSASALARLSRTIRFARGLSVRNLATVTVTVPLVLVLLYQPFRMGAQVTGGLDPNATVNAWGGPTYAGALLAHWLDDIVAFYAAAFLLSRLLLPAAAEDR